ncbi:hypothetical protein JQ594_15565 [Bradyrhizobium manausense]|uniref:phage pre-tape measure protein n=1 Tax=Bradyrhizobium manausense TaxID=989370 RepID=UPI001BA9BADE|nr:hypothetical protein [Bradyrhizobium manausense]MBR0687349.1 hypothetical protein [Bradyrhizobium manausense]
MAKVDIRDIAPGKAEITIDDTVVEVRGLSLHRVAEIVGRYPAILGFLQTGGVEDPMALLTSLPDAAIEIMAAGVGQAGDEAAIAALREWELAQQTDLLTGVLGRTFRGSAGPFVRTLLAAAARGAKGLQPGPSESAPISPPSSAEPSSA